MAKDLYLKLDLNLLRTFVILSQELNMRKASERLFVSQPAISQALLKLRNHFEDELFVKTRHGLKPTAFGEELMDSINPVMDELSSTLNCSQDFDPADLEGSIRIALAPHILTYLSSKLFHAIRKDAPNVDVHLLNWSPTTLEDLNKGEIAIGVNFDIHHAPKELIRKKVGDDTFIVYVRKDHPIKKDVISPKDVKGYEMANLIIPDWNSNTSQAERVMKSHGLSVRIGFRSELPMAVLDVVRHTDMVYPSTTFVPERELRELRGMKVTIEGNDITFPVIAYYHQKNKRNPTTLWLHKLINQLLQKETVK